MAFYFNSHFESAWNSEGNRVSSQFPGFHLHILFNPDPRKGSLKVWRIEGLKYGVNLHFIGWTYPSNHAGHLPPGGDIGIWWWFVFCELAVRYTCCSSWRADEWVLKGISGYIYGLYLKKTFGVNEYRHWIKEVTVIPDNSLSCRNLVIIAAAVSHKPTIMTLWHVMNVSQINARG